MQPSEKDSYGLNIGEPARGFCVRVWQLKIQAQVPIRQITWLRACLVPMALINDPHSARHPVSTVDKLGKAGVQQIRYIFKIRSVSICVKNMSGHNALSIEHPVFKASAIVSPMSI